MTNKDEAIASIKESLKRLMSFGSKEMKCEDMNLKDGSVISIEEGSTLDVGTPIYKRDKDGTLVPCEDGSYQLEDGRSITCKGGMVEVISGDSKPQEVEAGSPDSEAKMEVETEVEVEKPEVETEGGDMESRVKALEENIAQILSVLADMTKMTEKAMSRVEEFAAKPAEEPIKENKKEADVYTKTRATQKAFSAELGELRSIINKSNNSYGSFTVGQ